MEDSNFFAENETNYGRYNIIDGEIYDLEGNLLDRHDNQIINNVTMWMQRDKYAGYSAKIIKVKSGVTDEQLCMMHFGNGYILELLEIHPLDNTLAICDYATDIIEYDEEYKN